LRNIIAFSERLVDIARERGKTVCIQLSSGEITLMPEFLNLTAHLKELGCELVVISNGSKPIQWWREAVESLDQVVLSFHPERADLHHFSEVANVASSKIRTHLNVAAPPSHFEKALGAAEHLAANCTDVTILLKPMLVDFKDRLYPYTDTQLAMFRDRKFVARTTRPVVSIRGTMLAQYSDGQTQAVEPAQFIVSDLNHWQGWECSAGLELISIKFSGEIYRAVCGEGGPIGNIYFPRRFSLPLSPVVCTRKSCTCLLDIMMTRRSRNGHLGSDVSAPQK
jgi:hypothetical protein